MLHNGTDTGNMDPTVYALEARGRSAGEIKDELRRLAGEKGAEAIDFLSQLANTSDPKLAVAAVEALGWIRDQRAADALSSLADNAESKELRKRVKAMLFQLHSWGIDPSAPKEDAQPHQPREAALEFEDARITLPDHTGARMLIALLKDRTGFQIVEFLIRDGVEVIEAMAERLSKKDFDRVIEDSLRREIPIIKVDRDYVDFLMREVRSGLEAKSGTMPPQVAQVMDAWDRVMSDTPSKYTRPPVYYELDEKEIADDILLQEEARHLVALKEVEEWLLAVPDARGYHQKAAEVVHGLIQVGPGVREERVGRIIADAAEATFGGDNRVIFARRIEELAYYLLHTGKEPEAKQAFAVALALRRGDSLYHIPFVEAFVGKAIGIRRVDDSQEKGEERKYPLIINPFDERYRNQYRNQV